MFIITSTFHQRSIFAKKALQDLVEKLNSKRFKTIPFRKDLLTSNFWSIRRSFHHYYYYPFIFLNHLTTTLFAHRNNESDLTETTQRNRLKWFLFIFPSNRKLNVNTFQKCWWINRLRLTHIQHFEQFSRMPTALKWQNGVVVNCWTFCLNGML